MLKPFIYKEKSVKNTKLSYNKINKVKFES
jgi:hypothetical protein